MFRQIVVTLVMAGAALPSVGLVEAGDQPLTYEHDIRPIFRAHCFDCHGATEELKGGLDLRLVRLMKAGGESGPAIVQGSPDESYLLDRLRSGEMPPGPSSVPPDEIDTIAEWISQGAATSRPEPEKIGQGLGITPEERNFWSFHPIQRPSVPDLASFSATSRVRTPIDALILTAMPEGGSFSPDTDRSTLIRRAYLDLTGLPPTPDELQAWLNDAGDDWYDGLVDALLDSPHYGERWARHWLDVAGYADSEGFTVADAVRPWAWKYRDWVIRAFNADMPFDRFITEQLAGDEIVGTLSGDLTAAEIDLLTATGFLRTAADGTGSGADSPEARNQVVVDTLKIIGTSLLGLSVQCAQCHDHRYDPIPQTDYYALRAIFEPALDWQSWKAPNQRRVSLYTQADRQKAAEIEAEAQKVAAEKATKQAQFITEQLEKQLQRVADETLREPLRKAYRTPAAERTEDQNELLATYPFVRQLTPGQLYLYDQKMADELKKFDQKMSEIRGKKPPEEFLRVLIEPPSHAPETKLFFRGDFQQPKQAVMPAALTIAAPEGERREFASNDESVPTTGRRLAFARSLTSGGHPLFSRVIVNRIWMHHFGRGLVDTPSDFGKLGTTPTHPELLDWLADEFVQQGWSLKKLHRLILSSTVWRQSSRMPAELPGGDLANRTYWRKPIVRLEAEAIRDRMLAATGQLDRTPFGPPQGVKEDDTGQVVVNGEQTRRSLYVQMRRSQPVAMLQAFDAPVMETNCERRPVSTAATQSLMLMNGEFILGQASHLAGRAEAEAVSLNASQLADLQPLPSLPPSPWQFGYGSFDAELGRTAAFTRLPHWTGSAWQGGSKLPDADIGWVFLNANGGHPGRPTESAIRRWIAPVGGTVEITGSLSHGSENGDGVRGRIVSSLSGLAGEWTVHNSNTPTAIVVAVERGDTIDFITDCIDAETSDSFAWNVTIKFTSAGDAAVDYPSDTGFHGPREARQALPSRAVRAWELALSRKPTADELQLAVEFLAEQLRFLDANPASVPDGSTADRQALTNLCQTLLSCNEFLYVD